jgi:sterol desaturase/sphingolipid hydroxylase (fatty acid hydroxylase superfamily)
VVGAIVLAAALLMIAIELVKPGRRWPSVSGWWTRAILLNGFQAVTAYLIAPLWDEWLVGGRLWKGTETFGLWGGALFGYVVVTFVYYWWHRLRHTVPILWKYLHQVHHSPQRLEVITSFYKHPAEIVVNSLLSSFILVVICGLTPLSTALAILLTGLAELFYHWNVRTPYWLGFVFQRPESHCVHHREGWHAQNYSDLPLWDMLFGTFHNPRTFEDECGFADNRELQLRRMLVGVDVHATAEKR